MSKGTGWRGRRWLQNAWNERYLLRDEFNSPLAAGSVNATTAEPGPGTRTVVDNGSKLSIAGGTAIFAAGTAANDPAFWLSAVTKVAGTMLVGEMTTSTWGVNAGNNIGFDNDQNGGNLEGLTFRNATTLRRLWGSTTIGTSLTVDISYKVCIVGRIGGAGAVYLIKGGTQYPTWTLLMIDAGNTYATAYPSVQNYDAVCTSSFLRVPRRLWMPIPLASDGFPTAFATTDGTGHAETSGIGAGGAGLAWTQALGIWDISGAKANCGTLDGGTSLGIATVTTPTVNVVASVGVTRAAGAAGMVLRYTDVDNYLYAYHDGTNAALIEIVAGTPTNVVAATAATYSAGKSLIVVLDGAGATLYYNDAKVGATGTTNIATGAKHGLWSNNTGPTLDNFVVYARGTGGEYEYLNRFLAN